MPIVVSHLVALLAFAVLTVLVAVSAAQTVYKWRLGIACGMTAVWAGAVALIAGLPGLQNLTHLGVVLDIARIIAWLVLLGGLWGGNRQIRRVLAMVAAPAALIVLEPLLPQPETMVWVAELVRLLVGGAYLVLPIVALLALENIFRNADGDARWAVKFLCFGVGGAFAYDFYLYADALLLQRIDVALIAARGVVYGLCVPFIMVAVSRSHGWSVPIRLSRQFVFHSATVIGAGLYLVVMAITGFYLRGIGGNWGPMFQIIFLSGAVLVLAMVFASGAFRGEIRVFISKNFFNYKYDYRREWLRFIQTVSTDEAGIALQDRIVRAVADIVDSPGGGLWELRPADGAFFPTALWNFGDARPTVRDDQPLVRFFNERRWIVNCTELAEHPARYGALTLPSWMAARRQAWLVVPLVHNEVACGFLVLDHPRAQRSLNWEDYDLLKTVGRQAASYLAEEDATHALHDARQLEAFNQRFAFIAHDIKNLTSQLSLMVNNAKRHGGNAEFQRDMLSTVRHVVDRMTGLLGQLRAERDIAVPQLPSSSATVAASSATAAASDAVVAAGGATAALRPVLDRVIANWRQRRDDLVLDVAADVDARSDIVARGDAAVLETVLDHLLQNAFEASGPAGSVRLRLRLGDDEAIIAVVDDGPGMTADFVRDGLFRPRTTTKTGGAGIGAYQTRALVRRIGGRLEVESRPGEGTTMKVVLALVGEAAGRYRGEDAP